MFSPDLESMKPDLPYYWKEIAARDFVPEPMRKKGDVAKAKDPLPGEPLHVGGKVLPPKVLKMAEADFSPEARELHYSSSVLVRLIVNTDGTVDTSNLKLMRAAGMGLDEQALAAALHYTFTPATRDGVPVKVEITLDINFQIF